MANYDFYKSYRSCNVSTLGSLPEKSPTLEKSLSIAITICDKDFRNLPILIQSIKSKIFGNYEIIVIDNCENNDVTCDDDIIHIKTNENLYPFASRILAANIASGNYIWYIDGDDNIGNSININYLSYINYGLVIFSSKNIYHDGDRLTLSYRSLANKVLDNTLHNVFIYKDIYKKFTTFKKEKIWAFEDTLFLTYALQCCEHILIIEQDIYIYNGLLSGGTQHLSSVSALKKSLIGYSKAIDFIFNNYEGELQEKLFTHLQFLFDSQALVPGIDRCCSVFKFLPYSRNILFKENYRYIEEEFPNTKLDIIYIFYGKDLKKEISELRKNKNFNIIVLDFFNAVKSDEEQIIRIDEDIKNGFSKAIDYLKYNNILILESYKDFNIPNNFSNSSIIYDDKLNITDEYQTALSRNNVIFNKSDFLDFSKITSTLGRLSLDVCNFMNSRVVGLCNQIISTAKPFDESEITFFFFNFNNLLDNDYTAQFCLDNIKKSFPKATITVFNEDSVKEYIDKSQFTRDLINYRSTSNKMLNYENDVLRLLISKDIKKSIYLDLDVIIKNKDIFLKNLSTYPNYCPVDFFHRDDLALHNETLWTLGKSDFVEKNLKFYIDTPSENIINNPSRYDNCNISNSLLSTYGKTLFTDRVQTLDICSTLDKSNIHHFCGSRLRIPNDVVNVGIFVMSDLKEIPDSKKIFEQICSHGYKHIYCMRTGTVLEGYFHDTSNNGVDMTSLETFIDPWNTVELLKRQFKNRQNIRFIQINEPKIAYSIVNNISEISNKRFTLFKKYPDITNAYVISLDYIGFYLSDKYSQDELMAMDKIQLRNELKNAIIKNNPNAIFSE